VGFDPCCCMRAISTSSSRSLPLWGKKNYHGRQQVTKYKKKNIHCDLGAKNSEYIFRNMSFWAIIEVLNSSDSATAKFIVISELDHGTKAHCWLVLLVLLVTQTGDWPTTLWWEKKCINHDGERRLEMPWFSHADAAVMPGAKKHPSSDQYHSLWRWDRLEITLSIS
jgi:hypothetical protein